MTREQLLTMIAAFVPTIVEAGKHGVPSSVLYLAIQSQGVSLMEYQQAIDLMIASDLIQPGAQFLFFPTEKGKALAKVINEEMNSRMS